MSITTKELGLREFIKQIKNELLLSQSNPEEKFLYIEEIEIEINIVVSGDINSGFNLGVITLGSEVKEDRIQKIKVKLSPLVSKENTFASMSKKEKNTTKELSKKHIFRSTSKKQS
ncbi:MAG: hypothetical protein J0L96_07935 [Anaerolineae bacterium]|nr:hypothetical protein [Anaerolineae bacterium]